MYKIGINGMGRIGRLVFRAAVDNKDVEIVGVNDIIDAEYIVYLLKYDTVHGRFPGTVTLGEDKKSIVVNGKNIPVFCCRNPEELPWGKVGAKVVAECTGFFLTEEAAGKHLKAGCEKVVISAPAKGKIPMFVVGVNHKTYKGQKIVSNASCTTNCLAPITAIIDEKYGIKEGLMTTIHSVTSNQRTVDLNVGGGRAKWTRGRCCNNIIPTSTGAAVAVGKVYPKVDGKLTGMCFRVPTPDVSVVDLVIKLEKPICESNKPADVKKALTEFLKEAAKEERWQGVFKVTEDPVVASDFIHESHSSVFDSMASLMLNNTFIKVVAWYDNEWGYSNRMVDMMVHVYKN